MAHLETLEIAAGNPTHRPMRGSFRWRRQDLDAVFASPLCEAPFDDVLDLIPALEGRRLRQQEMVRIWNWVDSGEQRNLRNANLATANREQLTVIQDDWDEIWGHSLVSKAIIGFTSVTAMSPVPGGRPLQEVTRSRLERLRGDFALVHEFDDRWDWITQDMVGAFNANVIDDPNSDPLIALLVGDVVDERRYPVVKDLFPYEPQPL